MSERMYWIRRWFYRHLGIQAPGDLVAKFIPKRIRYWVLIREGSRLMRSNEVVPDVTFCAVLERAGR